MGGTTTGTVEAVIRYFAREVQTSEGPSTTYFGKAVPGNSRSFVGLPSEIGRDLRSFYQSHPDAARLNGPETNWEQTQRQLCADPRGRVILRALNKTEEQQLLGALNGN